MDIYLLQKIVRKLYKISAPIGVDYPRASYSNWILINPIVTYTLIPLYPLYPYTLITLYPKTKKQGSL
jgi:hypothetical protein